MSIQLGRRRLREEFICDICRDLFRSRLTFSLHCREAHFIELLPTPDKKNLITLTLEDDPYEFQNEDPDSVLALRQVPESVLQQPSIMESTSNEKETNTEKRQIKSSKLKAKKPSPKVSKRTKTSTSEESSSEADPVALKDKLKAVQAEIKSIQRGIQKKTKRKGDEVADQIPQPNVNPPTLAPHDCPVEAELQQEKIPESLIISVPISKLKQAGKSVSPPSENPTPEGSNTVNDGAEPSAPVKRRAVKRKIEDEPEDIPAFHLKRTSRNNRHHPEIPKTGKSIKKAKPEKPPKNPASPEKPGYVCPVPGCAKPFSKRNAHRYKNHLEMHEGLKPFVCPFCDFGYETDIKLIEHATRMHTKEKLFECEHCKLCYTTERFLKAHLKKFH